MKRTIWIGALALLAIGCGSTQPSEPVASNSLVGPPGYQGPAGPAGPQGPTGAMGAPGEWWRCCRRQGPAGPWAAGSDGAMGARRGRGRWPGHNRSYGSRRGLG